MTAGASAFSAKENKLGVGIIGVAVIVVVGFFITWDIENLGSKEV